MMVLHKMLNIEGISVYCNSYYIPLVKADQPVRFLYLKETIATQQKPHPDLNYIICPMTLRAQLTMDRHDPDQIKESQFKILTDISSLKLNISSSQITVLLRTVNKFLSFGCRQSHVEYRPTSERPQTIEWLRYLFLSYQQDDEEDFCDTKMIYSHELRAYTKLFAHHYINSNTKDGQKLIEK